MKLFTIAAIAAFLPLAAFAEANADNTAMMGEGLSMLGLAAQNSFEQLGIETDANDLTIAQLAEIHAIMSGEDNSATQAERIRAIIAN